MHDLKLLFDQNAADFAKRHELLGGRQFTGLWSQLTKAEKTDLEQNLQSNRWQLKGKLLHSERDPQREARRAVESFAKAQAIMAISVGAGFLLEALSGSVKSLLIIEPNAICAVQFILAGKFKSYKGKITLFVNPLTGADALEEILPWLQGKNLSGTHIYLHPPLLAIDKPLATRAFERVQALFEKRAVNQATIVKFQQLWNKNIFLNTKAMRKAGAMRQLWDLAPPEAIVLAGAGPSLTQSLGSIIELRQKFMLFAVDTALVPLNKAGIIPDFVFSADPQWLNHYFCQSPRAAESVWVMDPVVCPAIPRSLMLSGAPMLFWNNVFLADSLFREVDRGDVAHGGSVSTNAFDVAVKWFSRYADAESPKRLILVGQDLSFSNRQAHAAGAVLEAQIFGRSNRLQSMENHNRRQMTAMPVLWEKGIRQEKVRTNGKLKIFLDWFAARAAERDKSAVRFINATVDGARLNGFEHMPLAEAVEGIAAGNDIAAQMRAALQINSVKSPEILLHQLVQIRRLMEESAQLSADGNPTQSAITKLNGNDDKLRSFSGAKDIVGLNAQALILRITEQGGSADAREFYAAMARAARELGHWLSKVS